MSYDLWAVLIGDTITEEALPTYESWLMDVEGIDQDNKTAGRNGYEVGQRKKTAMVIYSINTSIYPGG